MSNFPGNLYMYNNPLISMYTPWNTGFNRPNGEVLSPSESSRPSSVITLFARVKAFHVLGLYLKEHDRMRYRFENEWQYSTPAQLDFKRYVDNYKPYISTEKNMTISIDYLAEGLGVRVMSNFHIDWMFPAIERMIEGGFKGFGFDASSGGKGWKILEAKDNFHLKLIQIRTARPKMTVYLRQAIPGDDVIRNPYGMVHEFLNWRRTRNFYRDVSGRFSGLVVPVVNTRLVENTDHLLGMCLSRWGRDGQRVPYRIAKMEQITDVKMNASGIGSKTVARVKQLRGSRKEGFNKPEYVVNRPFIMWLEADWIPQYPLIIGFYNKDTWVRK